MESTSSTVDPIYRAIVISEIDCGMNGGGWIMQINNSPRICANRVASRATSQSPTQLSIKNNWKKLQIKLAEIKN